MSHEILLKRIYEPTGNTDGIRILVDRLWPRGIKKEAAHIDEWAKETAPSTEIRRLYHQGKMPFEGFSRAYLEELAKSGDAKALAENCVKWLDAQNVTLVYAAKDNLQNHAIVLREWLLRHGLEQGGVST